MRSFLIGIFTLISLLFIQAVCQAQVLFPENKTTFYLKNGETLQDYRVVDSEWGSPHLGVRDQFYRAFVGGEKLTVQAPNGATRQIRYKEITRQETALANVAAYYNVYPFIGFKLNNVARTNVDFVKMKVTFCDKNGKKTQLEIFDIEQIDYLEGNGHAFNGYQKESRYYQIGQEDNPIQSVLFPDGKTTFTLKTGTIYANATVIGSVWGNNYRQGLLESQQISNMYRRAMAGGEKLTIKLADGTQKEINYSVISKQSTSLQDTTTFYDVYPFTGPRLTHVSRTEVDYQKSQVTFSDEQGRLSKFNFSDIERIDYLNDGGHAFNGKFVAQENEVIRNFNDSTRTPTDALIWSAATKRKK